MVRFWLSTKMNIVEKVSPDDVQLDCLCSLYLWDAQFGTNRLSFSQFEEGRGLGSPYSALLHRLEQPTGIPPKCVSSSLFVLSPKVLQGRKV